MSLMNRTSTRLALAQFFRQMSLLSSSGISLERALETCASQTSSAELRRAVRRLAADLRHGVRLSDGVGRVGAPFTGLHAGVVLAAENTGDFEAAFEQLARWEEKGDRMERRMRSLASYPLLVMAVAFVGTTVLLRFLAPLVQSVTDQVGGELSLPSRVVVFLGEATANPWTLAFLALGVGLFGWLARRATRTEGARSLWERWGLCLPVVGNLLWKAWMVRVARCLNSLLLAGLPMVRSIELAAEATGNRFLGRHVLKEAAFGVLRGETLSQALPGEMMSRSFLGMLSVGETSGTLPEMLGRVADLYEVELGADIDALFRATEPILMGVVGLVVLACLLCAFQPLYALIMRL